MRRMKIILSLCCALLTIAPALLAQDPDAEGCKDSPLISRFPGSRIDSCDNKEFDQATLEMKPNAEGTPQEKTVEGEVHTWVYVGRPSSSEIQIFRNMENALKRSGFAIDYEGTPNDLTAHKGKVWYGLHTSGSDYNQTVVIEKAMEQEVTASDLIDELNKSGHVAVYGINFDTGKATIQADSEAVLQQIVALMQQNPALKLRVEGHTDNVGAAAANQTLSQKRAQSVVAWLTAHGIAATRLTAAGFGATKPVADNSTEDGRAKNRRVELVKQ
jgi:OOP family OmpA-OmpF porin